MKKMLLLLSVGLLGASLALAQDTSPADPSATPTANTATSGSSVQGCLSGADGNYVLTQDGTGTTYKLAGDESHLKKHVGHEVAIRGQMATASESPSASPSDQGQAQPSQGQAQPSTSNTAMTTIQVSDIKMISKQCSAGGSAPQ